MTKNTAAARKLRDVLAYKVDLFLSRGPNARFLALLILSAAMTVACSVAYFFVAPVAEDGAQATLFDAMLWATGHVLDPAAFVSDTTLATGIVGFFASLAGLMVVAVLIGVVGTTLDEKLTSLKKGRSQVLDEDHTLILGFGQKALPIIRELVLANESCGGSSIVILSQLAKEDVEDQVRTEVGDMGKTRLVVRQGSPYAPADLIKVGAGCARSIIVLANDPDPSVVNELADQEADMNAIKVLLALRRVPGALTDNFATVDIVDADRVDVLRKIGGAGVEPIAMRETLARMMVQTARQSGLSEVYRDLLSFDGAEFYFENFKELGGQTFDRVIMGIEGGTAVGVRRCEPGSSPRIILNPPFNFRLLPDDELLVIADDEDTFAFSSEIDPSEYGHGNPVPIKTAARPIEQILVCGYRTDLAFMLRELDQYAPKGSKVDLLLHGHEDKFAAICEQLGALSAVSLHQVHGDPTTPKGVQLISQVPYDSILLMADNTIAPQEADAKTVIALMLLREQYDVRQDLPVRPRIVSEIIDPRTKDLVASDASTEFVVSGELVSLLLAQVSEHRELNAVFADLFSASGSEIYLKRSALYARVGEQMAWRRIVQTARTRGEIAIGYLKIGEPPQLNPSMDLTLSFGHDHRIIVIANNEEEMTTAKVLPTAA